MNSKITQASLKQSRTKGPDAGRSAWLPVLFAGTLFLSSVLLFLVQPMFARMVLPLLGGTPAVWNTCMVFFQAALLAGYAYAHLAPARLGVRRHAFLHLLLLLVPFLVLPITVARAGAPPGEASPIPWLLGVLTLTVGLPFFFVSTSGPLLQRWFAETGYPAGKDPYYLYSASNLGSMLALLSYPLLFEPFSRLRTQSLMWSVLYGTLIVLIFGCALVLFRGPSRTSTGESEAVIQNWQRTVAHGPAAARRLKWVALAFVPSSLMLSVTTYLTTDLAAIPLLWVVPLALYLLSFILVFARKLLIPQAGIVRMLPFAVLALTFAMLSQATRPLGLLLVLHLLTFFLICMVCHGELARQRPPVEHLTEYYLWLSVGGVLGGLFNALLAPLIFTSVTEYPLVLMLGCCLMPALAPAEVADDEALRGKRKRKRHTETMRPSATQEPAPAPRSRWAFLGAETALIILHGALAAGLSLLFRHLELEQSKLGMALIFGLPVLVCFTYLHSQVRFGLAIGILLLAGSAYQGVYGRVLFSARSFFGIHRVTLTQPGNFVNLVHGDTVHGSQRLTHGERAEPLTYYHRSGPIGQLFTAFSGKSAKPHVAIVGLGAGSLAYYGEPGQHFTYYEIDPTVLHIANDSGYFSFLHESRADLNYVLGDARLTLHAAEPNHYGLIVMDAFSSDAIPMHLLTREALALYKDKLAADGILAFHISNGYLDLAPELAALARDAKLLCWSQEHFPSQADTGVLASQWVLMAHRKEDLGSLLSSGPWQELRPPPGMPVWTDDFSNIFSVLQWR